MLPLLTVTATAQTPQFEGRPMGDIQFSPAQILDQADLARVFPLKKGEPLHAETVAQAIEQFAKSSRTSPYVVILDLQNPFTGTFIDQPRAWRGAYLQDLAEWRSQPGDLRFDGVIRDETGAVAK
jgi:hypothetical protein